MNGTTHLIAMKISYMAAGLCLLVATSASAQTWRPERPYRGLFASGQGNLVHQLAASGSVAFGYDDNVLATGLGSGIRFGAPSGESTSGTMGQLSGALSYTWQAPRFDLSATAATAANFYPSFNSSVVRASQADVRASTDVAGLSLSGSASVMHQPHVFGPLFPVREPGPGDLPAPDLDLAAVSQYQLQTAVGGSASYGHRLTQRTSLGANYDVRFARIHGVDTHFLYQAAGGALTHNLAKGLSARVGYNYREARYPNGRRSPTHGINAGIDFNRALSISRRTTLAFRTGAVATRTDDQLAYHLTGNAFLNHELGRTWTTWIAYVRDLTFHETYVEPVFADTLSTGVRGSFSRRVEFMASAAAARGAGTSGDAGGFDTYHSDAVLSFSLTRFMRGGVSYTHYRHRIDETLVLSATTPSEYGRHSVRVGVSLWAPLFERAGRTNASR